MTHVMVSYKREDEPRVAALVRALRQNGLEVWWDQTLAAGEGWREAISEAVETAGCVVVVWTRGSTGPDGGFVRDEATRARQRGVLVPVRLDDVDPPLGFGELQAIDLRRWRGGRKDPFFLDLLAACKAKLEGLPAPAAKGSTTRLFRRLRAGSLAAALAAALGSLAVNVSGVQDHLCAIPGPQPGLSDACGAVGLGHRPNREERLAWEARAKGSCADLRKHIARFPDGAYRTLAADLLAAATSERATSYSPDPRTVRGYVRQSAKAFPNPGAAQADATVRAHDDAMSLCAPADAYERLDGVDVRPLAFDCRAGFEGGTICALDYSAVCRTQSRALVERCGG